jgi:hypothetical protein
MSIVLDLDDILQEAPQGQRDQSGHIGGGGVGGAVLPPAPEDVQSKGTSDYCAVTGRGRGSQQAVRFSRIKSRHRRHSSRSRHW